MLVFPTLTLPLGSGDLTLIIYCFIGSSFLHYILMYI